MNDNISFTLADDPKEKFSKLPPGIFGLADAAYTLSASMLIPSTGADRLDPAQDAFNYYLSQLQIWVGGSINRVSAILLACARLQNFIIHHDHPFLSEVNYKSLDEEIEALGIHPNKDAPLKMSYFYQ
ncbi:hypothetical protein ACHAW6_007216 [Cyclotella cf. meneghiniana]